MQMATDARMELVQQKQQEAAEKLRSFQEEDDSSTGATSGQVEEGNPENGFVLSI